MSSNVCPHTQLGEKPQWTWHRQLLVYPTPRGNHGVGCEKHATNPKLLELGGSCPLGKLRLLSMVNIPKSKAMVLVEILSDKAMSLGDKGINCTSKCLRWNKIRYPAPAPPWMPQPSRTRSRSKVRPSSTSMNVLSTLKTKTTLGAVNS